VTEDWTRAEVEAIVADYFSMLGLELQGRPYSKTEHRRQLRGLLAGRSDGSISGYKPLHNYQELLRRVVVERLGGDRALRPLAEREASKPVDRPPPIGDVLGLLVEPPLPADKNTARSPGATYSPEPRLGVDYLAMEARNTALGLAGEQLAVDYEVARLRNLRKPELVERVEWISKTRGDGLGFDVLSFEPSGQERFIEVKITGFGKDTPFYLTRTELRFSMDHSRQFHLYRLFHFRKDPRLFALNGRLDQTCTLDPTQFIAKVA
jgi:hypothetical protein